MFDRKPLPSCQERSLLKGVPSDEQQKPQEGERGKKGTRGAGEGKIIRLELSRQKKGEKGKATPLLGTSCETTEFTTAPNLCALSAEKRDTAA